MPDILHIIDNVFILGLIAGAFFLGKRLADSYNTNIIKELEYQLRLMAAKEGVGYVAPPVKQGPIGQEFMDKLKAEGKATQRVNHSQRN